MIVTYGKRKNKTNKTEDWNLKGMSCIQTMKTSVGKNILADSLNRCLILPGWHNSLVDIPVELKCLLDKSVLLGIDQHFLQTKENHHFLQFPRTLILGTLLMGWGARVHKPFLDAISWLCLNPISSVSILTHSLCSFPLNDGLHRKIEIYGINF